MWNLFNREIVALAVQSGRPPDTVIAGLGSDAMASTRNQLLSLRIRTARNLAEFLADAPRTVIESGSEAAVSVGCTEAKIRG